MKKIEFIFFIICFSSINLYSQLEQENLVIATKNLNFYEVFTLLKEDRFTQAELAKSVLTIQDIILVAKNRLHKGKGFKSWASIIIGTMAIAVTIIFPISTVVNDRLNFENKTSTILRNLVLASPAIITSFAWFARALNQIETEHSYSKKYPIALAIKTLLTEKANTSSITNL